MRRSHQPTLIIALLLVFCGLGVGLYWALGDARGGPEVVGGGRSVPAQPTERDFGSGEGRSGVQELELAEEDDRQVEITWPLEIELELVEALGAPSGEIAPGQGATAELKGAIILPDSQGAAADIEFIAGPNRGRILKTDRDGKFGASNLYPGLAIVRVSGPRIVGSMREVRLRAGNQTQLNIGYGRPAAVYGEVLDSSGQPIDGAEVILDGQRTTTDDLGEFYFANVASGPGLALIHKPGYARYRERMNIPAASTIQKGRIKFHLEQGCNLEVTVRDRLGSRRAGELHLFASNPRAGRITAKGQRTFPWHLVSPAELHTGGTVTIEDLPAGRVNLQFFHAGAKSKLASVALREGRTARHVVALEPARTISGIVSRKGKPVKGARVSLEAPDRVAATLRFLGEPRSVLETSVFADFPPAYQQTFTDVNGKYEMTAWYDVTSRRYLRAEGPDGETLAEAYPKSGEFEIDLELEPLADPLGELKIKLSDRRLKLPVQVVVNGTPRDGFDLSPHEELQIAGLTEGSWRLRARWDSEQLVESQILELVPMASWAITLPREAIEGYDPETLRHMNDR